MLDAIVIGGGFAGVAAARELTVAGLDCTLIEARDRLGGRTWYRDWGGDDIELGGGWVHWHQPHAWAELTRAGQGIGKSDAAELFSWTVGGERRTGRRRDRHAIAAARLGPLRGACAARCCRARTIRSSRSTHWRRSMRRRSRSASASSGSSDEERDVIAAELEALAHGYLDDAGAVSVLRWHALSGFTSSSPRRRAASSRSAPEREA